MFLQLSKLLGDLTISKQLQHRPSPGLLSVAYKFDVRNFSCSEVLTVGCAVAAWEETRAQSVRAESNIADDATGRPVRRTLARAALVA